MDRFVPTIRGKYLLIAALTVIVTILHFQTPAGPHDLHWLHLFFQKLYYIPILLAAAWFGPRTTGATALAVTSKYLVNSRCLRTTASRRITPSRSSSVMMVFLTPFSWPCIVFFLCIVSVC